MQTVNYLNIPFLQSLGRLEIARLVPSFQTIDVTVGDVVFSEGDKGDALYIIVTGDVSIRRRVDEEDTELAVLGEGELFGEMALLTGSPRSASAVAATPLTLLRLSRQRFDELLKKYPSLGAHLANILARRMSNQDEVSEPHHRDLSFRATRGFLGDLLPLKKRNLAVTLTALLAGTLLALWLPGQEVEQTQAVLSGLLLGVTILWASDIYSYHAVALSLPVIIVILGLARPDRAFSGFSSPSWFLVLGIFAITAAVAKTGLMYRLVLMLARWFPRSYRGQAFALALSGLFLTPVIPSSNGRAVLAGPIVRDLCETLRFRKGSPGAVGMAMAGLLGFGHMSSLFLNGTATCLLALGLLPQATVSRLSWGAWLLDALPLGIAYFLGTYGVIVTLFRAQMKRSIRHMVVSAQLTTLGSFSRHERICLLTVIFTLAAFLTQPLHGIHSAWISMISFLVLFGTKVLDERSVRNDIDWNFMVSFGALVSFGAIISDSGLTSLAATRLSPCVGRLGGSPYLLLPLLAVGVTIVRLALPLPAALLLTILSVVPVADEIGIDPFIIAQVALISGNSWFSPYQNSVYLNFMESSDHKLFSHRQAQILSFWQVAVIVAAIIISIPFWQMRGLIR